MENTVLKEFYQLTARRATCRNFKPDPIPEAVMNRLLEAGCSSPSAGGFQTLSIIKVTDPQTRQELARCSRGQNFIATAPVSLVFCVDFHRMAQVMEVEPSPNGETRSLRNFWMALLDAAICAQTIVLAAEAEGLKSCYNGNIINRVDQVSQLLGLPELVFPAVMLTLGWPKAERKQPPKYPVSLMVHEETYQAPSNQQVYEAYREQNGHQKIQPKPELVEACCQMAQKLHGEGYAHRVRADIEKKGYIGPYQYWLGCYYQEEPGFLSQGDYWRFFRGKGFQWLEHPEEDDR